jgi:hypothetical protein
MWMCRFDARQNRTIRRVPSGSEMAMITATA